MQGQLTIKDVEKKDGKGGEYLCLTILNDKKQEFKGIMWNDTLKKYDINIFKRNAIIDIKESTHNPKFNNYEIKTVELIKEGILGLSEEQQTVAFDFIFSNASAIEDEALNKLVTGLLKQLQKKFKKAVGAKSHHHNYIGGLIQHTQEVLEAALALYCYTTSIGKTLKLDLIIAGAILHDIFKIKEYKTDLETGIVEMNQEWLDVHKNHLRAGWMWAMNQDQPELAHIIEAHHGITEWGAEQTPRTAEAWIIFLSDMASSKTGHFDLTELNK